MNEAQSKLDALVKELSTNGFTVVGTLTITKGGTQSQLISKTVVPVPVVEKPAVAKPL